ncbi:MAG TPA: DNA polymerase III subunit delta [Casimicrobiaceae bacterium]|jgi:DNA polymerase-3 subunit delta|nr:DNA polymerase III subunit delta [Casimicrobiaceae bacterium]
MQVRPAQLAAHLARGLSPLYVVHGDEPLLAIEAGDEIRAAARAAGYDDREILVAEAGFKWDALAAASRNLGLFGDRKLIDLRIPGGKPGLEGARVLEDCARNPSADTLMLITLPRLDRAAASSAWFSALEQEGVTIAVYPLERDELPRWIAARLARQKQRASADTLQFLADTTEGNLLAAQQEVQKLGLLLPEGELDPAEVEQAVADVARFDVFQLSEAWLAGDAARACRILASLESAGEGLPLLLWQLGEDIHALAGVIAAAAGGTPVGVAVRSARVWGKRQAAMERAAQRIAPAAIPRLLTRLARLDALAKGIGRGNAWDELRELALMLAGKAVPLAA